MSNRPKGFKRMPIFHITGFDHTTNKVIIKSFDERLPNDEFYNKYIKQAKRIQRMFPNRFSRRIGSKGYRHIFNIIKFEQS